MSRMARLNECCSLVIMNLHLLYIYFLCDAVLSSVLWCRLQELEQESPQDHPHIVTAEIHPQGREPPRMREYQPAQTDPDVVTFVNPLYRTQRSTEAPPTSTGRSLPATHSRERAPPSPEDRPSSVHFSEEFDYPTLKEDRGRTVDGPVPRPRGRALPPHAPPRFHAEHIVREEMPHLESVSQEVDRGTPHDDPGGITSAPLSPGYSPHYTQVRPEVHYSSYARVLPPPTTHSEDLQHIISELVAQKELVYWLHVM